MKLLVQVESGVVELNWLWLPTWIGHNSRFKEELEKELGPELKGKTLDVGSELVLDYICEKFSIAGLRDYLDGIKFVQET